MEALLLIALGCAAVLGWAARPRRLADADADAPGRGSRRLARLEVPGAPAALRAWPRTDDAELPPDLTVSGDEALDRVAILAGPAPEVLALLDEPARRALRGLVESGSALVDGVIRGVVPARELAGLEERARAALERLRVREDPLEVLVERLGTEPNPGVRRRVAEVLAVHGLQERVARATAADPDPALRLRSAVVRGDAEALLELLRAPGTPTDVREAAWRALRDEHLEPVVARLSADLAHPELAPGALARLGSVPAEARRGVAAAHVHRLRADPRRYAAEGELLMWLLPSDPEGASGLLDLARHAPAHVARLAVPHLVRALPADRLHDLAAQRPDLRPAIEELLPAAVHEERQRRLLRASGLDWSPATRSAAGVTDGWAVEVRFASAHDVLLVRGIPEVPPLSYVPGRPGEPPGWSAAAVPQVLAWLPAGLRDLGERATELGGELRVGEGRILCSVVLKDPEDLRARLGRLVALARALVDLACLPAPLRVRRAFLEEPVPELRRRFAAMAFEADVRVAAGCLDDPDLEVRRAAARACGAAEVLVALVGGADHPRAARLAALVDLEALDPDALSRAIALAWPDPALRAHALLAIGRCRRSEHAGRVATLVDELGPGAVTLGLPAFTAAMSVLTSLDDPEVEPVLIRGLSAPDPDLRVRILEALGRVGTGRCVPLLRRLGEASWSAEGRAARAALAGIRARTGVGGLALASTEGGGVALAPGEGRLSDAEPG